MSDLALYDALSRLFITELNKLRSDIMGQLQDSLVAFTDQVDKVFDEVSALKAEVVAVEERLVNLSVDPAVLDGLKASIQRVDDLNPDTGS